MAAEGASTEASVQLEACHTIGTHLLETVASILDEQGAVYFLDAGTLLGAVRHKGWIPWDDDVDIAMPRTSYVAVREALAAALPPGHRLSDPWTNRDHLTMLPRVVFENSSLRLRERFGVLIPERQRIVLDIFLIDNGPPSARQQAVWLRTTRALQLLASLRGTTFAGIWQSQESGVARSVVSIARAVSLSMPLSLIKRLYWMAANAWNNRKTPVVFLLNHGSHFRNIPVPAELFEHTTHVEFGGRAYPAPQAEAYLAVQYGPDFLQPPPEGKRIGHVYECFRASFAGRSWNSSGGSPAV